MKTTLLLGVGLCVVVSLALPWQVKAEEVSDSAATVAATADQAAQKADEAAAAVDAAGQELKEAGEALRAEAAADEKAPAAADAAAHSGDHGEAGAMEYSNEGLAQWLAMNAPGEQHAKLESFVGSFDLACKYWMVPGLPPQEQTGTSQIKWILDGRFIQEDYSSQMGMPGMEPQPFKGFGLTGYDNMKKQYVGIWSDTMSTGFVQTTGQFNDETGTLEMTSSFDDPMTGQPTTMRVAYKVVDENTNVMKAYSPLPGGGEYQCLEITYTRKP